MAASASAIEAGKAVVRIFASDLGLKAGLKRATAMLRSWAATTTAIGASLMGLGAGVLAPLGILAAQAASMGDGLNDAAAKTGIAVDVLARLGYAAQMSGTDLQTLQGSIRKMQVVIAGAADGVTSAQDALAGLGLTIADLQGLSPDEQFRLIADRISRIEDPAKRTAAAMDIFGRSGTDLLPMFQNGAAGIAAMEAEADRLGITMASTMAAGVGDVDDLLTGLGSQLKAFKTVVGAIVAESIRPLLQWIQPVIANAINWMAANKGLVRSILLISAGVVALGGVLVTVGVSITALLAAFAGIGTIIGAAVAVGVAAIGFLLSPIGLVLAAITGVIGAVAYFSGFAGEVLGNLGTLWTNLSTTAVAAWGGIVAAVSAGDLKAAGDVAWAALKVGWAAVIAAMKETWADFKAKFLELTNEMWHGLKKGFEIATNSLAKTWTTLLKGMKDAWAGFSQNVRDNWRGLTDYLDDKRLDTIAKREGVDRQALAEQANKDRAARDKTSSDKDIAAAAKREAEHAEKLAELERQHAAKKAQLEAEKAAAKTKIGEENTKATAAAEAEYQKKKAELDAAIAAARKAEEEKKRIAETEFFPAEPARAPKRQERPASAFSMEKPKVDMAALSQLKDEFENRGALSGFNLGSLNSGGLSAEMKKLSERTANATEQLVELVRYSEPGIRIS